MNSIVEKTTCYITVSFKDKTGALAAPSTARYKLLDVASGTEIVAWTELTPASQIEITLGILANTLLKDEKPTETRRLIVEGTYGADDGIISFFDYLIHNSDKV